MRLLQEQMDSVGKCIVENVVRLTALEVLVVPDCDGERDLNS